MIPAWKSSGRGFFLLRIDCRLREKRLDTEEVLSIIKDGNLDAYDLLTERDSSIEKRWKKMTKEMERFLNDVRIHFPDAEYYTASGGFNLLLGRSHSEESRGSITANTDLVAFSSRVVVGDGDW